MATAILAAAVVASVGLAALRSGEASAYRVDAVFDTAKGIVPGQLVKIAGARVGTVEAVNLTPGNKARITLGVDERFAPFRADARCEILPEGFISENFVQCDPGSAVAALPPGASGAPTVRLEQTTVPVSLQDVIDVFSLPVAERVRALINELGIATAGRGEDLNELLRRANPALAQARRALAVLGDQRREIESAVAQTDRVLARLARRRGDLRAFVGEAAGVADETAAHAAALEDSVRELPPMLAAADGGLDSLRRVATRGVPLVRELRGAAAPLTRLTDSLVGFSRAGLPALREVGAAAATGEPAVAAAGPAISSLRALARDGRPVSRQLAQLFASLADQGGVEALLRLVYQLASMSAAYDSTSHMAGVYIGTYPQCLLDLRAPACRHSYSAPGNGTIPVNAPSAGPQTPGAVLPRGVPVTGASEAARGARRDPKALAALLEFVLK